MTTFVILKNIPSNSDNLNLCPGMCQQARVAQFVAANSAVPVIATLDDAGPLLMMVLLPERPGASVALTVDRFQGRC